MTQNCSEIGHRDKMEGIFIMQKYLCVWEKKRISEELVLGYTTSFMLYMHSYITQDREKRVIPQAKSRLVPKDTNANTNLTNLTTGVRLLKQEGIYPDCEFQLLSACLPGKAVVSHFHPSV